MEFLVNASAPLKFNNYSDYGGGQSPDYTDRRLIDGPGATPGACPVISCPPPPALMPEASDTEQINHWHEGRNRSPL